MNTDVKIPGHAIEYLTESGFKLSITPLPPYYMDVIGDMLPILDLPRREIILLAGDVMTEEFVIPENPPDEFEEDYELYLKTMDVKYRNEQINKKKVRAKRDMLLSICVHIIEGPISISDQEWKDNLEAPFAEDGRRLPKHPGTLKLLFLKMIVLTNTEEMETILQLAIFREVTIQGISNALNNFPDNMGRAGLDEDFVKEQIRSLKIE